MIAVPTTTDDGPAVLSDYKDEIEQLYFVERLTYEEIADRYGKSREAVRQFLNRHFPDRVPGREFRRVIAQEEREAKDVESEPDPTDRPKCVICGDPISSGTGGRGGRKTCSTRHSELWSRARFLLDPVLRERQRQSMARSILRHKKSRQQTSIDWAKKIINGEPINTRTYVMPDSKAQRAYDEVMKIREEKGYHPSDL